jgi:hypothetical protein
MAKVKTNIDEYKAIFVKLHRIQHHGANNLISMLSRYLHIKTEYMVTYIDLVAEKSGVSHTGHITSTNMDVMLPIVSAMIEIEHGTAPHRKEIMQAWEAFITDYRNKRIKL